MCRFPFLKSIHLFLLLSALSANVLAQVPDTAEFNVYVYFSNGSTLAVDISLGCTDATIDQATKQATISSPAVFSLSSVGVSNECTATAPSLRNYQKSTFSCTNQILRPGEVQYCYVDYYYEPAPVPALQKYGLAVLVLMMLCVGIAGLRRFT